MVADVEVHRHTGKVRVVRAFVVHDCGQIINPDGVRTHDATGVRLRSVPFTTGKLRAALAET
jgi:CO/xanthine dehydrogenase Mo-binding subunit